MDKTKKRNSYNVGAINILFERYGFTKIYIRQCLQGDNKSVMADMIRKDYRELVKALNALVQPKRERR